jgi:hypothetical protein
MKQTITGGKMTDLTEHDRRICTEYLGECWHEKMDIAGRILRCQKCRQLIRWDEAESFRRTFTDPRDQQALKDRIVEMGKWETFFKFALKQYSDSPHIGLYELQGAFVNWLINPHRFCKLVAMWWMEGK